MHKFLSLFIILSIILQLIPMGAINVKASALGAVVTGADGITKYTLEHEYVKQLNINTGAIDITETSYTQTNGSAENWDSVEDAYVIKGQGTSTNNITITSFNSLITVYLLDLKWSGTINIKGLVKVVIVGSVVNDHSVGFLNIPTAGGTGAYASRFNLSFEGFDNNATLKTNYFATANKSTYTDELNITGLKINMNALVKNLNNKWLFVDLAKKMNINSSEIIASDATATHCAVVENLNIRNSTVKNIKVGSSKGVTSNYTIINSNVTPIYVFKYGTSYRGNVYNIENSTVTINGYMASKEYDTSYTNESYVESANIVNSYLNLGTKNTIDKTTSIGSTIELSASGSKSTSFIADGSSINLNKMALSASPQDSEANDLFQKRVRFRDFPNTYVLTKFPNGNIHKLITDSNGYLYPYVPMNSKGLEFTITDEKGNANYGDYDVSYDKVTGDDSNTYEPIPVQESTRYYFMDKKNEIIEYSFDLISWETTTVDMGNGFNVILPLNFNALYVRYDGIIYYTNSSVPGTNIYEKVEPIVIAHSSSPTYYAKDSELTLFVQAKTIIPGDELLYTWHKNGSSINGQWQNKDGNLKLTDKNNNLAGRYVCQIISSNGPIEVEIIVKAMNEDQSSIIAALEAQVADLSGKLTQANSDKYILQETIDSLQSQLATALGQISTLQNQVTSLTEQLASANSDNNNLNTQITTLLGDISTLQNQVTILQTDLDIANNTIITLTNTITELNVNISNLNSQVTILTSSLAKSEEDNELLRNQVTALNNQLEALINQVSNLQIELDTVKSSNTSLTNQVTILTSENTALTVSLVELQTLLSKANAEIVDLENEITNLTSSNESLTNQVNNLTTNNELLSNQVDDLTTQVSNLVSQNLVLQAEIDRLESLLNDANNTIEGLQTQVSNLTNRVITLEQQLNTANLEKDTLVSEKNELNTEINNLESKVSALEAIIAQLTSEGGDKEELIVNLNNTINALNSQISSLQSDLNSANTTIINLETTIINLSNNITLLENEVSILIEKVIKLEGEKSVLESTIQTLNETITNLELGTFELNNQINILKNEKIELQNLLAEAINTINSYKTLIDKIKTELGIEDDKDIIPAIKELKDKLDSELIKNETLQTVIDNITKDLDKAREENSDLIDKLESLKDLVNASDKEDITTKIEELLNTIESNNSKILQLEQEKNILIEQLNDALNKINNLLLKIEELQGIIDSSSEELELIISNLQKQIDEISKENVNLQSTLEQLRKDSDNLVIENKFLKSEIVRLESLLEEANSTIKELLEKLDLEVKKNESLQVIINNITDDLNAARQENLTLIDKLDSLKELVGATDTEDIFNKIEELLNTIEESNKKIVLLEHEKNTLIEKLDDALSKIQDLLLKIEELQEIIDSSDNELAKEISKLKEQILDLSKENNDLKFALEQLNNDSNELAKENQFLKSEIIRLESLLDTANSTINELRELVASLKVENELLKTENEHLKEKLNSNSSNGSNDGYYKDIIDSLKKEIEELKKGQISDNSIILTPGDDKKESIIEVNTNEIIEDKIKSKPGWEIAETLNSEWVKVINLDEVIRDKDSSEYSFFAREINNQDKIYYITVNVLVKSDIPSLTLEKTIYLGYKFKLNLGNVEEGNVVFTSSDTSIAKVNKNGVITPVSVGTATITGEVFKDNSLYKFVIEAKIKDGGSTLNLKNGNTQTISDTPILTMYKLIMQGRSSKLEIDNLSTESTVQYITSNADIVTVDKNGFMKGNKKGDATVTVIIGQGNNLYTYIVKVRVNDGTKDTDKWEYLIN